MKAQRQQLILPFLPSRHRRPKRYPHHPQRSPPTTTPEHQPQRIIDEPAQAARSAATTVHSAWEHIMFGQIARTDHATQNGHWEKGGLDALTQ
jgi:hypothetical protein